MKYKLFLSLIFYFYLIKSTHSWQWKCINDQNCVRIHETDVDPKKSYYLSLEVCRLVCGTYSALFPVPTGYFGKGNEVTSINPRLITLRTPTMSRAVKTRLAEMFLIFLNNVNKECGDSDCFKSTTETLTVYINVATNAVNLNLETDESYALKINDMTVNITADNIYGARHGLETLSQLMATHPTDSSEATRAMVMLSSADLRDKPVFRHRGVLLDTSRNFFTVDTIKRQLDGMAASKLNVMHWHITDSQSFGYESRRIPSMTIFGAYSVRNIYTRSIVTEIIEYALIRGIRVILELDAPAHVGAGWQWAQSAGIGNLSVCQEWQPWRNFCIEPPCGQINPANQKVYTYLEMLYQDIKEHLGKETFMHMGGDELHVPCWNSSKEVKQYMHSLGLGYTKKDFLELWHDFQKKNLEAYDRAVENSYTNIILWSSDLTDDAVIERYLNKTRYVIQIWTIASDPLITKLILKGYRVIVSTKNAWYLDHGVTSSTKYYSWKVVYDNRLNRDPHVLGGEVCLWSEYVDNLTVDAKLWPRAAAAAERMWSDPNWAAVQATNRMNRHKTRLTTRGIGADAITPFYCVQNEGHCL